MVTCASLICVYFPVFTKASFIFLQSIRKINFTFCTDFLFMNRVTQTPSLILLNFSFDFPLFSWYFCFACLPDKMHSFQILADNYLIQERMTQIMNPLLPLSKGLQRVPYFCKE